MCGVSQSDRARPSGRRCRLPWFPRLPHGGDIGLESAGFVPRGFGVGDAAYLADRFSKGNRHPGTDSILRLPGQELANAGVLPGDLLVGDRGKRPDHRRALRQLPHREIHRRRPCHHPPEGHIAFTSAGR